MGPPSPLQHKGSLLIYFKPTSSFFLCVYLLHFQCCRLGRKIRDLLSHERKKAKFLLHVSVNKGLAKATH